MCIEIDITISRATLDKNARVIYSKFKLGPSAYDIRLFEERSSYSFVAILNQTRELFFAPPGIYIYIFISLSVRTTNLLEKRRNHG